MWLHAVCSVFLWWVGIRDTACKVSMVKVETMESGKEMRIFEYVQYIKEIRPYTELAWTRWIMEEEQDYNDMFLVEAINNKIKDWHRDLFIRSRWHEMVSCN